MHHKLQCVRGLIVIVENIVILLPSSIIMLEYMLCILLFVEATNSAKYTTEQKPFSSSKISLAFTEKQQPWITMHFRNCPFYSLFSNYLRSQYLSVVYFVVFV